MAIIGPGEHGAVRRAAKLVKTGYWRRGRRPRGSPRHAVFTRMDYVCTSMRFEPLRATPDTSEPHAAPRRPHIPQHRTEGGRPELMLEKLAGDEDEPPPIGQQAVDLSRK